MVSVGIVNWGILPGLVIGVINYLLFFAYRYSPLVLFRSIREMKNGYDAFIISMEAAMTEESIYRCSFKCRRCLSVSPSIYEAGPIMAIAVKFSAWDLRLSCRRGVWPRSWRLWIYGGVLWRQPILGWILCGAESIEALIAAHFAANFLFFTASYLF
jgi:hypothetical protein